MNEFYNCNFKRDDIIIGINPENKFSYLKIFRIKDFVTHEEFDKMEKEGKIAARRKKKAGEIF